MNLKQRVFKLELQLKQRETTIEYVKITVKKKNDFLFVVK